MVEVLNQIKKLTGKYQTPFGLAVWGFTAPGEAKEILVDSEGRLQVVGEFTGEVTVPNIDVLLSTRASETTLSGIKSGTDYLDDIYGRLDIALSTFAGTPAASPPSRGVQLHGYDGTYARRVRTDADGYIQIKSV